MPRTRNVRRRRSEPPLLLILCEDAGGACVYIEQTFRSIGTDKIVIRTLGMGCEPRALLKHARTALKIGSRKIPKADFVFLVFDRDKHDHFADTVRSIQGEEKIIAFVSIPSIEFFFLLHAEMTTAAFDTAEDVIRRLKTHEIFRDYEKKRGSVRVAELAGRANQACERAASVRKNCRDCKTDSPYTDMDVFTKLVAIARSEGLAGLVGLQHDDLFVA